jgi:hypothetical protein
MLYDANSKFHINTCQDSVFFLVHRAGKVGLDR